MTKKQKLNLVKTAIYMLQTESVLKMDWYCFYRDGEAGFEDIPKKPLPKSLNECGTSACFAGHGPFALKNKKIVEKIGWYNYVQEIFSDDDLVYDWLFSSNWPNFKKQAAARAILLLENKIEKYEIEDYCIEYSKKFLTKFSIPQLIQRLEKIKENLTCKTTKAVLS